MPKETATAPVQPAVETPKAFNHPNQPVYVLVPTNEKDARACKDALDETYFAFMETPPEVVSELKPLLMRQDSVVYVVHPTRKRRQTKTGRFELMTEPHISTPFDFSTLVQGKGHVRLDPSIVAAELSKRCGNTMDRASRYFRAQVSSVDKKAPLDVMIKLTDL